jgi:hypothetical protein
MDFVDLYGSRAVAESAVASRDEHTPGSYASSYAAGRVRVYRKLYEQLYRGSS